MVFRLFYGQLWCRPILPSSIKRITLPLNAVKWGVTSFEVARLKGSLSCALNPCARALSRTLVTPLLSSSSISLALSLSLLSLLSLLLSLLSLSSSSPLSLSLSSLSLSPLSLSLSLSSSLSSLSLSLLSLSLSPLSLSHLSLCVCSIQEHTQVQVALLALHFN